jgi:hypothetical protein
VITKNFVHKPLQRSSSPDSFQAIEILLSLWINLKLARNVFTDTPCQMHIVISGSLLGALAFVQLVSAYFVYENICFLRYCVFARSNQRTTKLNTLQNANLTLNGPNGMNIEPSWTIQDTLQQVLQTWEYQRERRRKAKKARNVKFERRSYGEARTLINRGYKKTLNPNGRTGGYEKTTLPVKANFFAEPVEKAKVQVGIEKMSQIFEL